MRKIKSLEVDHLVAAAAPPESAADGADPECTKCNAFVSQLYYFCREPILEDDGEKFYQRGSHLPLTKKEMLMWRSRRSRGARSGGVYTSLHAAASLSTAA